jgi:hypothetical protein
MVSRLSRLLGEAPFEGLVLNADMERAYRAHRRTIIVRLWPPATSGAWV